MQVFKAYFYILRGNLTAMLVFMGIFLGLSIAFTNMGVGNMTAEFSESRPSIAIFIEDDSAITRNFKDYISEKTNIKEIENSEEALRDAFFFGEITYSISVPEGFADSIIQGDPLPIDCRSAPDSAYAAYMDNLVNDYFRFVKTYIDFMPDASPEDIDSYVRSDLEKQAEVKMTSGAVNTKTRLSNTVYFFNFFAYSLFAIIMHGMSSFMLAFNEPEIRRRNTASPMTPGSLGAQLIAGNFVFALVAWTIMFGSAFVLFGKDFVDRIALYYGINTIVYLLVCVSIGYLTGTLIRSKNAQAALVNVLSLGLSFLSGVFVPQELLGETALKIGSFTPTYWFVLANRKIINAGAGIELFEGIISKELVIQMLFALVLFFAAGIIRRKRVSV